MKKRLAAALLWFYVTWYAWALVASLMGVTELAGPVLGAALAAFIAGDPMHRIWSQRTERPERSETAGGAVRATAQ